MGQYIDRCIITLCPGVGTNLVTPLPTSVPVYTAIVLFTEELPSILQKLIHYIGQTIYLDWVLKP